MSARITDDMVEALAEFICAEFDFDLNPVVGAQWPEHANDDGYRGDRAYARLQPSDVQARARENATRILTFLDQRAALQHQASLPVEAPIGYVESNYARRLSSGRVTTLYAEKSQTTDVAVYIGALPVEAEGWQPIEFAPHACHVIATRFDNNCGEWVYSVVLSPPIYPFTHWRHLDAPPSTGGR